jgi:hypothetical protein
LNRPDRVNVEYRRRYHTQSGAQEIQSLSVTDGRIAERDAD